MGGSEVMNYELLNDIINIYEKEVKKNTKNKLKIYNFEKNKIQNINNIGVSIDIIEKSFNKNNNYNKYYKFMLINRMIIINLKKHKKCLTYLILICYYLFEDKQIFVRRMIT